MSEPINRLEDDIRNLEKSVSDLNIQIVILQSTLTAFDLPVKWAQSSAMITDLQTRITVIEKVVLPVMGLGSVVFSAFVGWLFTKT